MTTAKPVPPTLIVEARDNLYYKLKEVLYAASMHLASDPANTRTSLGEALSRADAIRLELDELGWPGEPLPDEIEPERLRTASERPTGQGEVAVGRINGQRHLVIMWMPGGED